MGENGSIPTIVAKAVVALAVFLLVFREAYRIAEPQVGGWSSVILAVITVAIVEASVFGVLSIIPSWKHKKKSEYGQEEHNFRVKSARARYCELGIDVSSGLLKALPPLAVTNLAVILALNQWLGKAAPEDMSDIERLVDIAKTSFSFFALAFLAAAILAWRLTPVRVKNERHAELSNINVLAIKTDALAALTVYKGGMPRLQLSTLRQGAFDDTGRLNEQWTKPNWRIHSSVSVKMQQNLADLYPDLVKEMDILPTLMAQYVKDFNTYSTAFQTAYESHQGHKNGSRQPIMDNHAKGRIIGSYFWYSGEILSLQDLNYVKPDIVQEETAKQFLQEFIEGDSSDSNSVSNMQNLDELKQLAQIAQKTWKEALDEYNKIISIIDEIHRRKA
jgi:hypothetical protein